MAAIDSHFSNFVDGGSLVVGDTVVGLRNGLNTRFIYTGGVGVFLPLAGGVMTGSIDMSGNIVYNSGAPSAGGDLCNKTYVDSVIAGASPLTTKGDLYTFTTVNARLAVGTINGQILQVNSADPTGLSWSTTTYPVTNAINTLLYASSANVISALATANNGVLITSAGGVPSIASTLPSAVQSNITVLGVQAQALDMGGHQINNGATPTNPLDYATKQYVDQTALNGTSVYAASAGSLGTVTQSGAGVGATLTNAGVQAVFALDGVSPPVGSNVLIKNTATGMTSANEGIYTVTNVGSIITNWVLTRATDYDTATEINNTGLILIQNGSTLAGQAWYNATTIVTVDTTAFSYSQFGNIIFPLTLSQGGTNASLTASNGGIVYSTSTGMAILSGTATASKMLLSGATAAPTWSTSTIPSSAGATAGKALVSDGTNYVLSSFAFPTSVGATGTILRSDGTNWVASTATYPATTTINQLLYSSSANVIAGVSVVNSAGLLTTSLGVPTWVAYTGTGAPVLGTAPTISSPKIDQINDQTNNSKVMAFFGVASGVNYINAVGSATGNPVGFQFLGTDSNISAAYTTTGTGSHSFYNGFNVSTQPLFTISGSATNTVNYIAATASTTTNALALTATGTDTNISINLISKGTGRVAIQGISTNTAAAAGYVGELLSATNLAGSPITFTGSTAKTLQTVTLTPGDWDVFGNIYFAATTVTGGICGISTTNNTQPDNSLVANVFPVTSSGSLGLVAPTRTFSVSSNTPVYLVGTVSGTGTLNGSGGIYARRRS